MGACKRIKIPTQQVCIGDMRNIIDIRARNITVPLGVSPDFGEEFTLIRRVPAAIKTVQGRMFMTGTNRDDSISHEFYIRKISGVLITSEEWINFNGENYDIVRVENIDERGLFLNIRANIRGEQALPVNFR